MRLAKFSHLFDVHVHVLVLVLGCVLGLVLGSEGSHLGRTGMLEGCWMMGLARA